MNEKPTIEVGKVPVITKFIYTLGVLPTSYLMSMTYEEQLIWLCNYIQTTLIPQINEDVEAIQELQNLYELLRKYVNDYFDNLDVQEEINNKLDEMAQNGSLTLLIKQYIDPIQEEFENQINYQINTQNNTINQINTKVNNAVSGSPLVASSTSDMTNTTRVYVNTSDGKWYYYDGTNWVAGGVYQSTGIEYDYSLNTNNAVPNSKTVGEHVDTLINNVLNIDDELIPMITVYNNKYINKTTGEITDGNDDFKALTVDISKLVGYEIEITVHQINICATVLELNDGTYYYNATQTGTISLVIPEHANILKTCNDETRGNYQIKIKNKPNINNIYRFTEKENIIIPYNNWDSLINASNKIIYGAPVICVLNNPVSNSGYLSFKIKALKDTTAKIIKLNSNGLVLDTYSLILKQGINEVNTPLYFNEGELIGIYLSERKSIQYCDVDVPLKYLSTSLVNVLYRGNTLNLDRDVNHHSIIFDYKLSIFSKIDITDYISIKDNNIANILKTTDRKLKIKLIGDSITQGVGGSNYAQDGDEIITVGGTTWRRNTNGYCWANLLKSNLESKYNCEVINNGCAGVSSNFLVDNISTLISDDDDIVICMIGTNNRNYLDRFNMLYGNLQTIYDYCTNRNIKFIVMASIPASNANESGKVKHMEDVNNEISAFADANNLTYIDLFEPFYMYTLERNISLNSLLSDGLHPNDAGYQLMYRLISKELGIVAKINDATW